MSEGDALPSPFGAARARLIVTADAAPAVRFQNLAFALYPLCPGQKLTGEFHPLQFVQSMHGETAVRATVILAHAPPNDRWRLLGSGVLLEGGIVATAGHVLDALALGADNVDLSHAFAHFVPIARDGSLRSPEQIDPDILGTVPITGRRCRRSTISDIGLIEVPSPLPPEVRPVRRDEFAAVVPGRETVLLATPDPHAVSALSSSHKIYAVCNGAGGVHANVVNLRIAVGTTHTEAQNPTGQFEHRVNSFPGTSGGPMFDFSTGRLIGLNTEGATGGNNRGVDARSLLRELRG